MTEIVRTDPTFATREALIVALCGVGLLVAAFAAPATAPSPEPVANDLDGEPACEIVLSAEPVPGQTVTAQIRSDGVPVVDSPVWFNGQRIGRTDERGRVTGTVPYEKELRIQVELERGGDCRAGAGTGGEVSAPDLAAQSPAPAGVSLPLAQAQQQRANGTGTYTVRGRIDISVARQPYPGEQTTIRATIEGAPVADAVVTVDGERVGRTDDDGRATITAPERGDGSVLVRVARGDFESERTVTVLRLDAALQPATSLPLPRQDATVLARLGNRPAPGAAVSIGGEQVGTTGPDGELALSLPSNPTAQVTVETADQSATVPVAFVFAPTLVAVVATLLLTIIVPAAGYAVGGGRGLLAAVIVVAHVVEFVVGYWLVGNVFVFAFVLQLLSVGLPFVGYRTGGRRGFGVGVLSVLGVYQLLGVFLLFGPLGLAVTVALDSLVVGVVGFLVSGRTTADVVEATTAKAVGVERRFSSGLLVLTDRLERWLDDLEARLRDGSLTDLRGWLLSLPARAVALAGLLVASPLAWLRRDPTDDSENSEPDREPADETTSTPRERFRRLWRRFASRVAPDEWSRRTAGEVSRRAIERGLPAGPVEELTTTFRAVEYGGEPLTDEQVNRASSAVDTIERDGSDDGEGPQ